MKLPLVDGTKFNLESNVIALESQVFNVEIFNRLTEAKDAMAQARGDLDADKVADIMDDMMEEKSTADQIAEAICQGSEDVLQDEDLLEEYRLLEEAEIANTETVPTMTAKAPPPAEIHPAAASVFQMPEAPTGPIANATQEELDQLKELQSSMMI